MGEILGNANWLAVIVSMVLGMALGFGWYNPKTPTGRIWAEGTGVGTEQPDTFPALAMGMNTLGLFLLALLTGATMGAPMLMILIIAAFGAFSISGGLFGGFSAAVGVIHTGYWLAAWVLGLLAHNIL